MYWLPLVVGWWAIAPVPPRHDARADLSRAARLSDVPARTDLLAVNNAETETAEYAVQAAARSSWTFVLPNGPRTVRAFEIIPTHETAAPWASSRLRITWEDDDTSTAAGYDLPLGLAFGRSKALPVVNSPPVGTAGGAWVCRFPMPYRDRALLRVDTTEPIGGRIRIWTTRGADPDAGYFRGALWTYPRPLTVSGRGQLVGFYVRVDGRQPPEYPRLLIDGKASGWPLNAVGDRYQWRIGDPVVFSRSFEIGIGPKGAEQTESAAVFWYSEEPGPGRGKP